jgi:hypothetical protein
VQAAFLLDEDTEDVRKYAAERALSDSDALESGLR